MPAGTGHLLTSEAAQISSKFNANSLDTATPVARTRLIGSQSSPASVAAVVSLGSCVDAQPRRLETRPRRLARAHEIKPAESSQRQLLQHFRDAIDSVGHMVAIFDIEDRMIAYNRNYREGYRVGDRDLPPHVRLEGRTYRECMELRAKYKLHR